ncbi:hypothetical protein KCU83_g112, partial [Aureobasidium melanogenum]
MFKQFLLCPPSLAMTREQKACSGPLHFHRLKNIMNLECSHAFVFWCKNLSRYVFVGLRCMEAFVFVAFLDNACCLPGVMVNDEDFSRLQDNLPGRECSVGLTLY